MEEKDIYNNNSGAIDLRRVSVTHYITPLREGGSLPALADGRSVSPIAAFETHERFRWLTAVRSASIATSRPHPGLCTDLDNEFDRLFSELVE